MGLYKYSKFNIEADNRDNKVLLFNSFTLNYRWIDQSVYYEIKDQEGIDIGDVPAILANKGFIVPDELDEIAFLKSDVNAKLKERNRLFVSVFLTLACNYRCVYCFEKDNLCSTEYMSTETADNLVRFIKERYEQNNYKQPVLIKWFGGEPLLAMDKIRYITEEVRKNNIPLVAKIYTNGRLLDRKTALELKELGVTEDVTIPIDGLEETYASQKGCSKDDFYKVIKNIQDVEDILRIVIHINVSEKTKDDAKRLYSLLRNKYHIRSKIKITRVEPQNTDTVCADNSVKLEDTFDILEAVTPEHYEIAKRSCGCEARYPDYYVVNVNGDLYRCEHLFGQKKFSYGNIKDYSGQLPLKNSIWDVNRIINDCKECPILPICIGHCTTNRYYENLDCESEKRIQWFARCVRRKAESEAKINSERKDLERTLELVIAVTGSCNYHCSYCFEQENTNRGSISKSTIEGTISFISNILKETSFKKIRVTYFGGEPLLNVPAIKDIACRLKEITDIPIIGHLTTNGRCLTPQVLDELKDCDIKSAQITFDGMSKDYARLKGCEESDFYAVIDNIKAVQDRIHNTIRLNVSDNKDSLKELISYIMTEEIKCDMYLDSVNHQYYDSREYMDSFQRYVETSKDIISFIYSNGYKDHFVRLIPNNKQTGCSANTPYYFVIDTEGYIYKCTELIFKKEYAIGSVLEGITNDELNNLFLKNELYDKCNDCKIKSICQGKCTVERCIYNKGINCEALEDLYSFQIQQKNQSER